MYTKSRDHDFPCVWIHFSLIFLTDDHGLILREVVGRNFEVQRSWALPYTSRDIVVRTVAGTEPATEVTSLTDRDTTKVSTDTYKKHISFCSPR